MNTPVLSEQVGTLSSEVQEAIGSFAEALAGTLQFQEWERARLLLQGDVVAQQMLQALQAKQDSLEIMLKLNAVSQEEREGLQRLQESCMAQPSVAAYGRAQAELAVLCTALASVVSRKIGLDFAGACGVGCGCRPSGVVQMSEEQRDDPEVSEAFAVADTLGTVLQQAEPLKSYGDARSQLDADAEAAGLLDQFMKVLGEIKGQETKGGASALAVERARNLQRRLQRNPVVADYARWQQGSITYAKAVNGEISGLLGFDFASLCEACSC